MGLLAVNSDAKTSKGQKLGYFTGIMYLSPHKMANGQTNVCGHATPNCIYACLNSSGRGAMNSVQTARINKTLEFLENPKEFMVNIYKEIVKLQKKYGNSLAIRLNGTSDLPFENIKVDLSNFVGALLQSGVVELVKDEEGNIIYKINKVVLVP